MIVSAPTRRAASITAAVSATRPSDDCTALQATTVVCDRHRVGECLQRDLADHDATVAVHEQGEQQ